MDIPAHVLMTNFNIPIAPDTCDYCRMIKVKQDRSSNTWSAVQYRPANRVAPSLIDPRLINTVPPRTGIPDGS